MIRSRRQAPPVANPALRPALAPAPPQRRPLAPPAPSSGRPLESPVRADMERRFGHDFGRVRVHAESRAPQALGASAMTTGRDVSFAPGRHAPSTPAGYGLLAHELAHVVQQDRARQRGDAAALARAGRPGDRDERGADAAVRDLERGRRPSLEPAAAGLHRQSADTSAPPLSPGPRLFPPGGFASQYTSQSLILESFLNRMWAAQSDQGQPFRLTPKVLEGLAMIFPQGVSLGALTDYDSTTPVLDKLKPRLTGPIDPNVVKVLDRLPAQEQRLGRHPGSKPAGGATAATPGPSGGDRDDGAAERRAALDDASPRKQPPATAGADEAMTKALQAAFETFRRTRLGKELEKSAKEYVFSKEGIPLVILVTTAGLAFLAANDPKLPSVPAIPVGEGISLKVELSARGSEVPGLLGDLVHGRGEPAGTPEKKVGVSATLTFEAAGELAGAVGHFFAEAASWIAKGAVKAGTAIARGARSAARFLVDTAPELLYGAAGAGLGAGIGALAGGGMGALVGAGIGLAVGVGSRLAKRFLTKD